MLKAFEISSESKFKDSAWHAAKYLLSHDARPMNATFFCRRNPEKDFCNGLIGQAWVIEALAVSSMKLEDPKYIEVAKNVFMLHPFDYELGLWRKVNVDGSYSGFDITFNHQLWFAAAGAILSSNSDSSFNSMVIRFLDRALESNLKIYSSGCISHTISNQVLRSNIINKLVCFLRKNLYKKSNQMSYKEIGYHAFNMYAFSLLKQYLPDHPIWKNIKFLSALNFLNKKEFVNGLGNNIFGYYYNLSGFEVAFTIQEFCSLLSFSKSEKWWVEQQLRCCYNSDEKMLSRSTEDKETLSARLYEATRLKDLEVMID
jgi:hypothetical protein